MQYRIRGICNAVRFAQHASMTKDTEEVTENPRLFSALAQSLVREGRRPSCFDSQEQFISWLQRCSGAVPAPSLAWCEDCTPEYQARMKRHGRCTRPYVQFFGPNDEAAMPTARKVHWLRVAKMLRSGELDTCPEV